MENFPSMYEMYLGMHNFMAPQVHQLITYHDLKGYKSCIDLGGEYKDILDAQKYFFSTTNILPAGINELNSDTHSCTLVMHNNFTMYNISTCVGGTGVVAFELRKQYPEMDVTVFEMENVVELAIEKFIPGNEHLGVKFVAGLREMNFSGLRELNAFDAFFPHFI